MREDDALDNNPLVSRQALAALHDQLYGWSLSRCGYHPSAAEDLMQQAYVEILSGRARFDEKSSLKTFLFAVVQMLARSRFRRLASTLRLVDKVRALPDSATNDAPEIDAGRSQFVWQAVQGLPARQRDMVELVFCREMTIEEAARVMGVSTGTGRTHYDRAKKALAITLASLHSDINDLGDRYA